MNYYLENPTTNLKYRFNVVEDHNNKVVNIYRINTDSIDAHQHSLYDARIRWNELVDNDSFIRVES